MTALNMRQPGRHKESLECSNREAYEKLKAFGNREVKGNQGIFTGGITIWTKTDLKKITER